jgi:hypothetical protein
VGYEFVKQLSSLGIPTQTLVRTKEAKELLASLPNVKSIIGDAFDENAVQKAMEGCIAAVTTLGKNSKIIQNSAMVFDFSKLRWKS